MDNKELEYLGFNPSLQGNGLKIAVFEYYPSNLFYKYDIKNPLNANWKDINGDNDNNNHVYKTTAYWKTRKSLAQVIYLPQNDLGLQYAIDNNFHIATFSATRMVGSDILERKLAEKTFLISSAGNFTEAENLECWWAVSALHLQNGNLISPYYCNYESSKIKSISLSNIQYEEGSEFVEGTSFSNVTQGILVADFYEAYQLKFGFYPTIDEVKDFIKENSKAVLNNPLKEGYGLFTLPKNLLTNYNFGTVIKLNSNEINVNGTIKTTVNPAQIINNKTMVELTVLRECKGNRVYWNDKVKCAIVK